MSPNKKVQKQNMRPSAGRKGGAGRSKATRQPRKGPRPPARRPVRRGPSLDDLAALTKRCLEVAPPTASAIATDPSVAEDYQAPRRFHELPISPQTAEGLEKAGFRKLTPAQRLAIPHGLVGRDVVLAAKTGSGKTLAFVIPLLEALHRAAIDPQAGLAAVVLAPTIELSLQLFDVLNHVGVNHGFSIGLVGRGSFEEEALRLPAMNIIVGTPTRVLEHLTRGRDVNTAEMRVLVLDEADTCLSDADSAAAVAEIGTYFNTSSVQLMLASATLGDAGATTSALALDGASDQALTLKDPEFVNVHAAASEITPAGLRQVYVRVSPQNKLAALYSFLRASCNKRLLVFVSTRKEARFLESVLRRMQPGLPVLSISGRDKLAGRIERVRRFDALKHGALICTDVAARGIDFNKLHAVLQYDCPADVPSYVHRVGRAARAGRKGTAVLFLTTHEASGFVPQLEASRVPIMETSIDPEKARSVQAAVDAIAKSDPEIRARARGALEAYVKSVDMADDKAVFSARRIDVAALARSWGLSDSGIKLVAGNELEQIRRERAEAAAKAEKAKAKLKAIAEAQAKAEALERAGARAAAELAQAKAARLAGLAAAEAEAQAHSAAEESAEDAADGSSSSSEYEYEYQYEYEDTESADAAEN